MRGLAVGEGRLISGIKCGVLTLEDRCGEVESDDWRRPGDRGGRTPGCSAAPDGVIPNSLMPPMGIGTSIQSSAISVSSPPACCRRWDVVVLRFLSGEREWPPLRLLESLVTTVPEVGCGGGEGREVVAEVVGGGDGFCGGLVAWGTLWKDDRGATFHDGTGLDTSGLREGGVGLSTVGASVTIDV